MESMRATWRLLAVVQMRDYGGSGDGEKWMDISYIFEVQSTELALDWIWGVRWWKRV